MTQAGKSDFLLGTISVIILLIISFFFGAGIVAVTQWLRGNSCPDPITIVQPKLPRAL